MNKSINIRAISKNEYEPFIKTMFMSAGISVDDDFLLERKESFSKKLSIGAFYDNKLVGTIGGRRLKITMPSYKSIELTAIGQGGVLPNYTRKGIMSALMIRALNNAKKNGDIGVIWTTSEWPLYGKFGGGVSSFKSFYKINKNRVNLSTSTSKKFEIKPLDEVKEIFISLHNEYARNTIGCVQRNQKYWDIIFSKLASGKSLDVLDKSNNNQIPLACISYDSNNNPNGCLIYRIDNEWENEIHKRNLSVIFFVNINLDSYLILWDFLLNIDLVENIILPHRPINERIRWHINDGRRLLTEYVSDHVWFRIIDIKKCLELLIFPKTTSPIIKIDDKLHLCQNEPFEIVSDGFKTHVSFLKEKEPDIIIDVQLFSSIVFGGVSLIDIYDPNKIIFKKEKFLHEVAFIFKQNVTPFSDTYF